MKPPWYMSQTYTVICHLFLNKTRNKTKQNKKKI